MTTRRWVTAALAGLVATGAGLVRAGDEAAAVLAAHDKRIALTIAGDLAGLGGMMTDDLTYTHANAVTESKAEFLDGLKTGRYLYREITPRDRKVRVHGNAALVSGPCHVVIEPRGQRTEIDLYFTELYVKEGGTWKMALWQSTRLPAPVAK